MLLTERQLKNIISNSVSRIIKEMEGDAQEPEVRKDKNGNILRPGMQGWGYWEGQRNVNPNGKDYNPEIDKRWLSRSVAASIAVFAKGEDGEWYVLANQRGSGTPDYQGYWCMPCGYLDYNEDTAEAACREAYEETGVQVNKQDVHLIKTYDDIMQNQQNVVFFYATVLPNTAEQYGFSTDNMEENEVSGIKWININDVDNIKFAFDHDELIKLALRKLSHSMGDEENYSAHYCIQKAMRLIQQGGDAKEELELLNNALEQID